jgi:hypothetical protein
MSFYTLNPDSVAREDLVVFINACFACTGQREFYDTAFEQRVSVAFLHQYICGNYRKLYARTLAAGINHFNQAQIIFNLLATGKNTAPDFKSEERALVWAALQALPTQRAWKILTVLRNERINNRRVRAIIRDFVASRRDLPFEAVKYRQHLRAAASHAHLQLPGEVPKFLFEQWRLPFKTPIFELMRQAQHSHSAIYQLPYTIAEGMAAKHQIPREKFLAGIAPMLTERERLRLQGSSNVAIHPERLPLTALALYLLGLPSAERRERLAEFDLWLHQAAQAALGRSNGLPLQGRVAAVLDHSYSSAGSREKQRRPLAVALACHYLLQAACPDYRPFWTQHRGHALLVTAYGQTNLADRLLDALEWGADTVLIVSDGAENDPWGGVDALLWPLSKRSSATVLHLNPVFDAERLDLRALSPLLPPLGLRDGEDLALALGFGRLVSGKLSLPAFEQYLAERVRVFLRHQSGENTATDGETL